jgi:hypothetical protein
MYARVATFESDPAKVDDAIAMVRAEVDGEVPPGWRARRCSCSSIARQGKGVGVTLFDTEDAMRRGDEALNAMNPGSTERRVSVEFFEVPVQTVSERFAEASRTIPGLLIQRSTSRAWPLAPS